MSFTFKRPPLHNPAPGHFRRNSFLLCALAAFLVGGGCAAGGDDGGDGPGFGDPISEDPGSGVLSVFAAGDRIGIVTGVSEFTITVFDPDTDTVFELNDQTGHVAGGSFLYSGEECTGAVYIAASGCRLTGSAPTDQSPPSRRFVRGADNGTRGVVAASELLVADGELDYRDYLSQLSNDCFSRPSPISSCTYRAVTTTVIPTTFPLPITFEGID